MINIKHRVRFHPEVKSLVLVENYGVSMTSTGNHKRFPGFEHIYELEGPFDDGKTFFAMHDDVDDDALQRAESVSDRPLVAKWNLGAPKPGDIASACTIGILFISERVRGLLKKYKLTGWSTYPVALYDKAGKLCEGFVGLSITGRCGPQNEECGELVHGQNLNAQFPQFRGIYFDESTWDGSDFFLSGRRGRRVFVTEAVKRVFEDNAIANVMFTPLTEATWIKVLDANGGVENDKTEILESLYMDQELDPAGFVEPFVDEVPEGSLIDYTVIQPADNAKGMELHVCSTFEEAKVYALHLQAHGVRQLVILRSHQVFWRTPGLE